MHSVGIMIQVSFVSQSEVYVYRQRTTLEDKMTLQMLDTDNLLSGPSIKMNTICNILIKKKDTLAIPSPVYRQNFTIKHA